MLYWDPLFSETPIVVYICKASRIVGSRLRVLGFVLAFQSCVREVFPPTLNPKPYTLCGYTVPKFGDPCRGVPGFDVAAACTYGLGYLRLERVLEAFELLGFSAALRSLSASILEASASQIRCLLETGLNNPNGVLGVYHALVRRGRCNTESLTLRPCLRSLARWDKGL